VFGEQFRKELWPFNKLQDHIQTIIGLEHSLEFHKVGMIEHPVDSNFIYNCRFSILLTICGFLGESLNGVLFAIPQPLPEIDRREVALTDLLHRFEQIVKAPLVDSLPELDLPLLQVLGARRVELSRFEAVSLETHPDGLPENLLSLLFGIDRAGLPDDFEGDVKCQLKRFEDGLGWTDMAAHHQLIEQF
jgi:hypothetical protein